MAAVVPSRQAQRPPASDGRRRAGWSRRGRRFSSPSTAATSSHYRGFAGVDTRDGVGPGCCASAVARGRFERRRCSARWAAQHEPSTPPTMRAASAAAITAPRSVALAALLEPRRPGGVCEFWSTARRTSSRRPTRTRGRSPGYSGAAKAALVEIQADEYGNGRRRRMHAELFADDDGGARARPHLRRVPRPAPRRHLATTNLDLPVRPPPPLARRALGHLALFEMTSVGPMGRYAHGAAPARASERGAPLLRRARRGGQSTSTSRSNGWSAVCSPMSPSSGRTWCSAPAALGEVERRLTERVLRCWRSGRSSLLPGSPRPAAEPPERRRGCGPGRRPVP